MPFTLYIPSIHTLALMTFYGGLLSFTLGTLELLHMGLNLLGRRKQVRRARNRFEAIYQARHMYLTIVETMADGRISLLKHDWNNFKTFMEGFVDA